MLVLYTILAVTSPDASRGTKRKVGDVNPILPIYVYEELKNLWGVDFVSREDWSWEGGISHPKILIILPRTYEKLKESHIGPVVSEILSFT